jgi:hypothetical protein
MGVVAKTPSWPTTSSWSPRLVAKTSMWPPPTTARSACTPVLVESLPITENWSLRAVAPSEVFTSKKFVPSGLPVTVCSTSGLPR